MSREELVEEAAKAMLMVTQEGVSVEYAWSVQFDEVREELIAQARAALAVFEAAQAPTGDEREELIGLQLASYSKRMSDGYTSSIIRSNEEAAEIVLDAGFRLPVQGEPTDAQVLAALNAWYREQTLQAGANWGGGSQDLSDWSPQSLARARAALRAALKKGENR